MLWERVGRTAEKMWAYRDLRSDQPIVFYRGRKAEAKIHLPDFQFAVGESWQDRRQDVSILCLQSRLRQSHQLLQPGHAGELHHGVAALCPLAKHVCQAVEVHALPLADVGQEILPQLVCVSPDPNPSGL